MGTPIRPGTYVVGFVKPDSREYTQFRCPACWYEFELSTDSQIEILTGDPVSQQCLRCDKIRTYTDATPVEKRSSPFAQAMPKIRKKRVQIDTPLFGGIDGGYDLCHKRID